MKIALAMFFLIWSNWAFASGIMIRPPVLDPCRIDPDSDRCLEQNQATEGEDGGEGEFDQMEADVEPPPPPVKKKRARRSRRKNPCLVDKDSESCKRLRKRYRQRTRFRKFPCKMAPKSKACLKKRAQQRDEG